MAMRPSSKFERMEPKKMASVGAGGNGQKVPNSAYTPLKPLLPAAKAEAKASTTLGKYSSSRSSGVNSATPKFDMRQPGGRPVSAENKAAAARKAALAAATMKGIKRK